MNEIFHTLFQSSTAESSSSELIKHAVESWITNKVLVRSDSNIDLSGEYQTETSLAQLTNQASMFLM